MKSSLLHVRDDVLNRAHRKSHSPGDAPDPTARVLQMHHDAKSGKLATQWNQISPLEKPALESVPVELPCSTPPDTADQLLPLSPPLSPFSRSSVRPNTSVKPKATVQVDAIQTMPADGAQSETKLKLAATPDSGSLICSKQPHKELTSRRRLGSPPVTPPAQRASATIPGPRHKSLENREDITFMADSELVQYARLCTPMTPKYSSSKGTSTAQIVSGVHPVQHSLSPPEETVSNPTEIQPHQPTKVSHPNSPTQFADIFTPEPEHQNSIDSFMFAPIRKLPHCM